MKKASQRLARVVGDIGITLIKFTIVQSFSFGMIKRNEKKGGWRKKKEEKNEMKRRRRKRRREN